MSYNNDINYNYYIFIYKALCYTKNNVLFKTGCDLFIEENQSNGVNILYTNEIHRYLSSAYLNTSNNLNSISKRINETISK